MATVEDGERLSKLLVENKLAACVTLIPGGKSTYIWDGKLEQSNEHLLLIKSPARCHEALKKTVEKHHPYDLPELIALNVTDGSIPYLEWVAEATL